MNRTTNDAAPNGALLKHQMEQLGKLSWLWMNCPLHREWSLEAAARFLIPPIRLNQIEIIERDGMPVAYCSWAWLGEAAEIRYMIDSTDININDWNGDGADTADFSDDTFGGQGVWFDLASLATVAQWGFSGVGAGDGKADTTKAYAHYAAIGRAEQGLLESIENVIGTSANDILIGDGNANVLDGGEGSDQRYLPLRPKQQCRCHCRG